MNSTVREAVQTDQPFLKQMLWGAVMASPTLTEKIGIDKVKKHEDKYWANWPINLNPALIAIDQAELPVGALLFLPNQEADSWRLGMGGSCSGTRARSW